MSGARGSARTAATVAAVCVGSLSGCTVGPRYDPPVFPAPPAFKEASAGAYEAARPGAWKPAQPQDAVLKGKWWEVFNEPELSALEDQLNINNQNIAQYFQNFMAARAQVNQARAGLLPVVAVAPAYTNSGAGTAAAGGATVPATGAAAGVSSTRGGVTITNFFSLPIDVSWEPDLWGRIRNTVHEAQYAAQVSAADLENERLTEQADLAAYFFDLRGQDALQDLLDRTVEVDRQALDFTRALVEAGIDGEEAVAEAEVTLENAEVARIGVATNRALYEHGIATLIGKPASTFSMPVKMLTTPVPRIPVVVPSQLLQRRPDIAAAERTMAQANAAIGVATAAYYPTLSLTGTGGLQSPSLASLFSLPALFWSLGASATETIFDGGLRGATVAQYAATYKADVAAYKQTVLTAFQQVEDSIATLRVLSQQIDREGAAVHAARAFVDIAMGRYETGLDPYLNVITAQTILLSDQQTEVTLRVSEMTAAVQLIQALGGGWDVKDLPSASQVTSKDASRWGSNTP